jgi:hypothetical protein
VVKVVLMILAASLCELARAADAIYAQASIWPYTTLCAFDDPPNSSLTIEWAPGASYSVTAWGCKNIEQKHGHPPAVRVTLKNAGAAEAKVTVESLDNVVLTSKAGKTFPAIARREMLSGPAGGSTMTFVAEAKAEGVRMIVVDPGKEVDLVFLFTNAAVDDTIRLGKMKSAPIK